MKVSIVHFKVLGISPSFTKEDMRNYTKPPHRPGEVRHKEAINTAYEVIVDELEEYDDCLHVIKNLDDLHTVLAELPIEQHAKVLADLTERLESLGFSTLRNRRTLLNTLVSSKDDILTLLHALPNDVSCHTIMFLRRLDNFQKCSREISVNASSEQSTTQIQASTTTPSWGQQVIDYITPSSIRPFMNALETIQQKPEKQLNGYQLTLIDQARLFNRTLDAFKPLAPETLNTYLSHEGEALGPEVDALIGLIERNIFLEIKRGAAEEMFAQAEELHQNHEEIRQHFEEICRLAMLGEQAMPAQVQVLALLIENLPPTGMIQLFNSLYISYLNQEGFLPYWKEAFIMCGFSEEDLQIIGQPSEVTVTEQALIPRTDVDSLEQKLAVINCFIDQLPILVRHSLENLDKRHLDKDKIYAKAKLLCNMMPYFLELKAQIQANPSNETLAERINLLAEMTLCICAFETNKAEKLTCTSASATDNIFDTRLLQTSSSASMLKALSPVKPSGSCEHKPLQLAVQGQVIKALLNNVSPINVGVMFKQQLLADPTHRMWQEPNQVVQGIKSAWQHSLAWLFGPSDTATDVFHPDTSEGLTIEILEDTHEDAVGLPIGDGLIGEGVASLALDTSMSNDIALGVPRG